MLAKNHTIIVLLLVSICFGCKKTCFESTGAIVRESQDITSFSAVVINSDINLIITQDTITALEIEAGKNLIDKIIATVINDTLYLENQNTCGIFRNNSDINVYIKVNELTYVKNLGNGNIRGENTIKSDNLFVILMEVASSLTLDFEVKNGVFKMVAGTADMSLTGTADNITFYSTSVGILRGINVKCKTAYVTNSGSGNIDITVSEYLNAEIYSLGNIEYAGHPITINKKIISSGQLIPL